MGLPFNADHILAMRRFPASSVGPGYRSVWHRDPGGRWTFFQDLPSVNGCARYFSSAVAEVLTATIDIESDGPRQLARFLSDDGLTSSVVDIRGIAGILHLKSGIAWIGRRDLVVIDSLAGDPAFRGWERIAVAPPEGYAANCVRVNGTILFAEGFPSLERTIRDRGHRMKILPMSEFQKMDGGLSCLSLRF